MNTIVTNPDLPAYNRTDRVPPHALQCGLLHSESDLLAKELYHLGDTSEKHVHVQGNNNNTKQMSFYQFSQHNHARQLDSTGSRQSIASTVSSTFEHSSQEGAVCSADAAEDQCSVGSTLMESVSTSSAHHQQLSSQLQRELYITQTSPPPYNKTLGDLKTCTSPPRRTELPKKSQAAKQSVADLIRKDSFRSKSLGKGYESGFLALY